VAYLEIALFWVSFGLTKTQQPDQLISGLQADGNQPQVGICTGTTAFTSTAQLFDNAIAAVMMYTNKTVVPYMPCQSLASIKAGRHHPHCVACLYNVSL
jgi:hypothetical protein